MILSDQEILKNMDEGNIVIEPFNRDCLGSNSYDVHLSEYMAVYTSGKLDARQPNNIQRFTLRQKGYTLYPNMLYLGSTVEFTETLKHVPFLEGKSSIGRLGIDIHATAGKGDVGFRNHWTLEISVKMPVTVYPNMPIGQIIYFSVQGDVINPYNKKKSAKYNERSPLPMASKMHKNF